MVSKCPSSTRSLGSSGRGDDCLWVELKDAEWVRPRLIRSLVMVVFCVIYNVTPRRRGVVLSVTIYESAGLGSSLGQGSLRSALLRVHLPLRAGRNWCLREHEESKSW